MTMKTHDAMLIVLLLLGAVAACDEKRGTALVFEAVPGGGEPVLALRLRSLTATRLELEIASQGFTEVAGLAFRLSYLPASLRLVSVAAGDGWPTSALVHGTEPTPGLTVGAVSLRGPTSTAQPGDRVLAVVTLDVLGTGVTPITLVPGKNGVAQSDGSWVRGVGLRSGQLVRR
jgi:hypothetical protein